MDPVSQILLVLAFSAFLLLAGLSLVIRALGSATARVAEAEALMERAAIEPMPTDPESRTDA